MNGVTSRFIEYAARRAPATLTARLVEEWSADLLARCGPLSRLSFALGCLWAAVVIRASGDALSSAVTTAPRERAPMAVYYRHRGPRPVERRTIRTPEGVLLCEINTTPLIDVMLVLLVTLIVTLPLMTHAVKLDLPQAPPIAASVPADVIDLEVDFDGTVVWNGAELASWQQLESLLHGAAQSTPQPRIHLRPDRRVKYEIVARVLAAAQRNQMQHIELVGTDRFKD